MSALPRYNSEQDLKSLFGLHLHSYTHWLRPLQPHPLPLIPHLGSYTRALLHGQPRQTTSAAIALHVIPVLFETAKFK